MMMNKDDDPHLQNAITLVLGHQIGTGEYEGGIIFALRKIREVNIGFAATPSRIHGIVEKYPALVQKISMISGWDAFDCLTTFAYSEVLAYTLAREFDAISKLFHYMQCQTSTDSMVDECLRSLFFFSVVPSLKDELVTKHSLLSVIVNYIIHPATRRIRTGFGEDAIRVLVGLTKHASADIHRRILEEEDMTSNILLPRFSEYEMLAGSDIDAGVADVVRTFFQNLSYSSQTHQFINDKLIKEFDLVQRARRYLIHHPDDLACIIILCNLSGMDSDVSPFGALYIKEIAKQIIGKQDPLSPSLSQINISKKKHTVMARSVDFILHPLDLLTRNVNSSNNHRVLAKPDLLNTLCFGLTLPSMDANNRLRLCRCLYRLSHHTRGGVDSGGAASVPVLHPAEHAQLLADIHSAYQSFHYFEVFCMMTSSSRCGSMKVPALLRLIGRYLIASVW